MGLLSTNDVYTGSVNPDATVNPKTIGAMWINYETGVTFICKDNTKDKNVWENNVYPVGSCFITIKDGVDPNEIYGGTWKLEGGDRALWSSGTGGGEYISPGLPNIYGEWQALCEQGQYGPFGNGNPTGSFSFISYPRKGYYEGSGSPTPSRFTRVAINASLSSDIYQNDINTVQPPAIKIYLWIRTA